jgi:glycosyltransferase involved in cell wall biosynthesis
MNGERVRRVMLLVTGPLDERLAGPEIRSLQFAKELGSEFEVTLVAQRDDQTIRDGISVLPASRRLIMAEATRHDLVISPSLPPYLLALKRALRLLTVADQYDPHESELVTLEGESHDRELRTRRALLELHMRQADLILCASARQRLALIDQAAAGGRELDPVVVPFGITPAPAPTNRRPLHERFPQLGANDRIVLWWGSVWQWLDAETPIRASARLAASHPDIKLVITAGSPPNSNNARFEATEHARALARDLGVYGRSVLFLDDWIPYEDRYDYLREATLGLTLHRSRAEAHLAARARYMDYLSVALPCVLGGGDEVGDEFERAGYARLVDSPAPDELALVLLSLLDEPERLAACRAAGERLAAEREWGSVGSKLRSALRSIPTAPDQPRSEAARELASTASYYGLKGVDRLRSTFAWKSAGSEAV